MAARNHLQAASELFLSPETAPSIETSGRLQHQKSMIHGLMVKCDWLKTRDKYIRSGRRSQCLVLTSRIVGSEDEDASELETILKILIE